MSMTKDKSEFANSQRSDAPLGSLGRFPGLPTGIQLEADWYYRAWCFGNRSDAQDFVDNDLAPDSTMDGLEWEQDNIVGTGATISIDVNGFPPHMLITTPATDTRGQQMQHSVGTRELFDFSIMREAYIYGIFRLSDANDNAATLTQSQFAFGLGPIDTTVLAGIDDYIGFYKGDASAVINAVCDDDSAALSSYPVRRVVQDLSVGGPSGVSMAGRWFGLGMKIEVPSQSNNQGLMHTFYDAHLESVTQRLPTHRGSAALVEVPDQPITPTIAFAAGEATAKRLSIAKLIVAGRYRLGITGN